MMLDISKPQPYVGVSGVVSPEMQDGLVASAAETGLFDTGTLLALGVKAVHKTQYLDVENKYGREWYPVGEEAFASALHASRNNPDTIAVAQTYLDIDHVADADYRRQFVKRIVKRAEPWIQAIQFDMLPWHSDAPMLHFLESVKADYDLAILLQCHNDAMTELGPRGAIRRLGHVASFTDYILFDASHGTGQRLDVARLDSFLEEANTSESFETTGLAVAGGLNESVVRNDLPVLVTKYPDLSWDAEGQLHPVNAHDKRPLDLDVVTSYLKASVDVITG